MLWDQKPLDGLSWILYIHLKKFKKKILLIILENLKYFPETPATFLLNAK